MPQPKRRKAPPTHEPSRTPEGDSNEKPAKPGDAATAQPVQRKRRGQIVDYSNSGGLGVSEAWCQLFEANEVNYRKGKVNAVLTDPEIEARMHVLFPGRNSAVFKQVHRVRNRYNRGSEPGNGKEVPRFLSRRYERIKGKVIVSQRRRIVKKKEPDHEGSREEGEQEEGQ